MHELPMSLSPMPSELIAREGDGTGGFMMITREGLWPSMLIFDEKCKLSTILTRRVGGMWRKMEIFFPNIDFSLTFHPCAIFTTLTFHL